MSLRDLQWRRRRFVIGVLATAVLFAVTLVLAGLSDNMHREVRATIESIGADHWVVVEGTTGPISGVSVMPIDVVDDVASTEGVDDAAPLVMLRQSLDIGGRDSPEDIVVFGVEPGAIGQPKIEDGRAVERPGEAVVDSWSGLVPGDVVGLGATRFEIVGTTTDRTMMGGISSMYADIDDVHAAVFQGVPLIQAVLVRGSLATSIDGYVVLTPEDVVEDIMRPIGRLLYSVSLISLLLWTAAAAVVGSIVYLTAVERTRDFAVFKATGASSRSLYLGLAAQAILATGVSALLSVVLAFGMLPLFPVPLSLSPTAVLLLVPVTVVVGLLASAASIRRVVATDPALAFASS